MKGDIKKLRSWLENQLFSYAFDRKKAIEITDTIYKEHNLSAGRIMDIITQRVSIEEVDEFELFCLSNYLSKSETSKYFTEDEIKNYSKQKRENPSKIKWPIKIKCVQVSYDSYIGVTDTNFFMKLRANQLINYNTNAQRNMDMVVRGEHKYYKISLNKAAVEEIKDAFSTNYFIPNTITLNIPLDKEADYYYDEKKCELVINKLKAFDISDGYHRYVAMGKMKDADPEWNYPMEIRITNFSDDKMKSFIFQEDKKTRMRKIDSDAMNMNNQANILTERINQDVKFIYKGRIQRNGGNISFSEFSNIINYLYFKNKKNSDSPSYMIELQKTLVCELNEILYELNMNDNYIYSFKELCIILYGIYNYTDDNRLIINVFDNQNKLDSKKFSNKTARKSLFTEIEKLYRGC